MGVACHTPRADGDAAQSHLGAGLDRQGRFEWRQRMVLGLLDHGSRACLRLSALTDK